MSAACVAVTGGAAFASVGADDAGAISSAKQMDEDGAFVATIKATAKHPPIAVEWMRICISRLVMPILTCSSASCKKTRHIGLSRICLGAAPHAMVRA